LIERLTRLYESMDGRDRVEIAILTLLIYAGLRLLGRTRGSGLVRGLSMVGVGLFLAAQVVIAGFDLLELGKLLDSLLLTGVVAVLVIFQPEFRRGLMILGRDRRLRLFAADPEPVADRLAASAVALSRDKVGALIAVQRDQSLTAVVETGERLDAAVSPALIRSVFSHHSPLHDGALVVCDGRLAAAGCQLPLLQPGAELPRYGMRHRAALGLSEETDALLVVVSEETGRISLAQAGRLEPVPREELAKRLAAELRPPPAVPWGVRVAGWRQWMKAG
jgi:diadenylate cyclase